MYNQKKIFKKTVDSLWRPQIAASTLEAHSPQSLLRPQYRTLSRLLSPREAPRSAKGPRVKGAEFQR